MTAAYLMEEWLTIKEQANALLPAPVTFVDKVYEGVELLKLAAAFFKRPRLQVFCPLPWQLGEVAT